MKTFACILSLFILHNLAYATDLTLTDGRVLKDAAIISQTPLTVTIQHAAGLSSVTKAMLPPELKAKYPADETAARIYEEKNQQARLKGNELEEAEYQRALKVKAEREKSAKFNERAPFEEEATQRDRLYRAKSEVQIRAEKYFETEYEFVTNAKNIGRIKVAISDLSLIEGWSNRWTVRGKCEVEYNGEVVRVYPHYSPETVQEHAKAGTLKDLDYTPYDTTQYSTKTQDFSAIYNAEIDTPTFEVVLH